MAFLRLEQKNISRGTYSVLMGRLLSVRSGGCFCFVCSWQSLLAILLIALILSLDSGRRQPRVYFLESYRAKGRVFLVVQ